MLHRNIKAYLNLLWQSILFWVLAYIVYVVLRFYGLDDDEGIQIKNTELVFSQTIIYAFFMGSMIGFYFSVIEFFYEKYASKKIAIWLQLVTKTLIYLIVIVATSTFIRWLYIVEHNLEMQEIQRGWWHQSKSFWVSVFYFLLAVINYSFIKMAVNKFGKQVFFKMLFGTYKKPKEEERIFMFLDLRSSTAIAEKLGHYKYSQFIQDCFYDLNEVVAQHEVEIYQYVGDEAVLTWPFRKGIQRNNCLTVFFDFQNKIQSKESYYQQKYGVVPEFKAGLHGGSLMVAEVGSVKQELAYHGDVINTAARIQSLCNEYEHNLIISEDILKQLSKTTNMTTISLGEISLKGKTQTLELFGVNHKLS